MCLFIIEERMKKSLLHKHRQCLVCERRCIIKKGETGHCKTRINKDDVLYTLNYDNISSISINPIEKKPLFHFYPGSRALTVGFWSCNFDCPWCQNHDISKVEPQCQEHLTADAFVNLGLTNSCEGISLSFNEPTVFLEWGIEALRLAREKGLYNTIVTNGYMTEQALKLFIDAGLDAANVDIKGDTNTYKHYCHADDTHVWRNCNIMKEHNIHLELTTLLIPSVNDDIKIVSNIGKKIVDEFGDATPWHLTRYFPAYKFSMPATPISFLENAFGAARDTGMKFVYLGNIPGHEHENTYCPQCGALLIERAGMAVVHMRMGKHCVCPNCNAHVEHYFIV
jgi:pyruvate formate lyase activating enzyme